MKYEMMFNGKKYDYLGTYEYKSTADGIATMQRKKGNLCRIIPTHIKGEKKISGLCSC